MFSVWVHPEGLKEELAKSTQPYFVSDGNEPAKSNNKEKCSAYIKQCSMEE